VYTTWSCIHVLRGHLKIPTFLDIWYINIHNNYVNLVFQVLQTC
jgi:hypothetical protein